MSTWFPDIIDLVMRDENISLYRSEQLKSFHYCVSVLLSNQAKELLSNSIRNWTDLFVPGNSDRLPLFRVELVLDEEGMQFLPRFEQLESTLTDVIHDISKRMQNIQVRHYYGKNCFSRRALFSLYAVR